LGALLEKIALFIKTKFDKNGTKKKAKKGNVVK
jgi:hypothetical protein